MNSQFLSQTLSGQKIFSSVVPSKCWNISRASRGVARERKTQAKKNIQKFPLTHPHIRLCRGERAINNHSSYRRRKRFTSGNHVGWKCLKIYFYILCSLLRIFLAEKVTSANVPTQCHHDGPSQRAVNSNRRSIFRAMHQMHMQTFPSHMHKFRASNYKL